MGDSDGDSKREVSPDDIVAEMEPLQPYTTPELASRFAASHSRIKRLLDRLFDDGAIERKGSPGEKKPVVWIRNPPLHTCSSCGREFRVRFSHPVLGAVQFCPKCGTQLKR